MPHIKQDQPFVVPTTDGKLIEEHFGHTTNEPGISIAHMLAPAGWSEPFQNPEFDEYTLVSRGKKLFEVDGEKIEVHAGQSILIKKGSRVRYSNPFDEPCEYWSVCLPAFSISLVHRED
jgi:mannose-6-phosphate isomerase-like protein (cupin superfamily)